MCASCFYGRLEFYFAFFFLVIFLILLAWKPVSRVFLSTPFPLFAFCFSFFASCLLAGATVCVHLEERKKTKSSGLPSRISLRHKDVDCKKRSHKNNSEEPWKMGKLFRLCADCRGPSRSEKRFRRRFSGPKTVKLCCLLPALLPSAFFILNDSLPIALVLSLRLRF
jgi:hypothetical protein